MASFAKALDTVITRDEGGYVYSFNPKDTGGGTYAGIARNKWPSWEGWAIVDALKPDKVKLATDETLKQKVFKFYYTNFLGKQIEGIRSQEVATKFLSMIVNMDTHEGTLLLQRAVNYVTPDAQLVEDGTFGPATKLWVNGSDSDALLAELRAASATFYCELIVERPDNETFKKGWFRRAAK